jgi:2-oxo-3-hexenedioate decarboxylase
MAIDEQTTESIASRVLAASEALSPIAPISNDLAGFDLADAYRVSAEIVRRRMARGERPVGWKIGFTNRTIWDEYGVHAPIWGPIYDTTAGPLGNPAELPLARLMEPRIEPEIALRIARTPHPEMDERELFGCIDGIAHGFEIVQSVFPEWKFRAADTVAAFALHSRYRHGPILALDAADRETWPTMLANFEIALFRDGVEMDRGKAENVLGSPLSALRHFVRGLAEWDVGWRVRPSDLVTTGTITRAFPIRPGERWSTEVHGLPLDGITLRFT